MMMSYVTVQDCCKMKRVSTVQRTDHENLLVQRKIHALRGVNSILTLGGGVSETFALRNWKLPCEK